MTRPLIVFLMSFARSHVLGSMGLARRLIDKGFDVEYWGNQSIRPFCSTQGFDFKSVSSTWPCYEPIFRQGLTALVSRPGTLAATIRLLRERRAALPNFIAKFEASIDAHIGRRMPDLVVLDTLLVAYFPLFQRRGIRSVVLNDKPPPSVDPLVPPPDSRVLPRDTVRGRALIACLWALARLTDMVRRMRSRCIDTVGGYVPERLIAEVQRRASLPMAPHRIRRWVKYDVHFEDIDEWVLGTSETDLPRSRALPANVRYVGACVDFARVEPRYDDLATDTKRRLVFVSMGITLVRWDEDMPLLRRVVAALGGLGGVDVIVATGSEKAHNALPKHHPNITICSFVPQLALLRRADLAITHGGAYTVRECIASNVPMLVFPRVHDQAGNAARVAYHGIGLSGSRLFDSAHSIRRKTLRILDDDGFKRRVAELNQLARKQEESLLDVALSAAAGSRWSVASGQCLSGACVLGVPSERKARP